MSCKLRSILEAEEHECEEGTPESNRPPEESQLLHFSSFADLYSHLDEEVESASVDRFLQELMEKEVAGRGMQRDLRVGTEREGRKKQRDPRVAMEIRHQQVRDKRAQKDAERAQKRREDKLRREAWKEARLREQQEQSKRRQVALRQEKLLQQEVVRLRREMEEKRSVEKQAWLMEKERQDKRTTDQDSGSNQSTTQQQQEHKDTEQLRKMQMVESRIHMMELRYLQRHFSRWHSAVLRRQVQMGKAAALADWRNQLRAWRAWKALVWTKRVQREVERTEEDLRSENRQCQTALESDRRRLLKRCLNSWQAWCCMERGRREMLSQREETQRRMEALIDAAAAGRLRAAEPAAPPETPVLPPSAQKQALPLLAWGCELVLLQTNHKDVCACVHVCVCQAQLKAEEEARCREEEEEKQAAAKRKKEEKRLERERELEKQCRLEQHRQKVGRAQEQYRQAALRHRGLEPWKRLVEQRRADEHVSPRAQAAAPRARCLLSWAQCVAAALAEKEARAATLYRHIVLRRSMCHWLKVSKHILQHTVGAAVGFCSLSSTSKAVQLSHDSSFHELLSSWFPRCSRRLMRTCFRAWRALPLVLRQEREKEERREHLRRRVAEVLPDFHASPRVLLW
uniref:Coiled-coil domain containing 191 n=1 Tax=Scleropages formosus TaxID=113540 RepID=A0A8C9V579_SCLFO